MAWRTNNKSLVPAEAQNQLIPQLPKGATGTVRASEENYIEEDKKKKVVKDEGNKHIEQKATSHKKEENEKSAEASLKVINEGGVKKTIATTKVETSSSFESEETFEETIRTGPTIVTRAIKEK